MKTKLIKAKIREHEQRINELKERIELTHRTRTQSKSCLEAWKNACNEFHNNYDALVFEGFKNEVVFGETNLYTLALEGELYAMEYAVCFLEVRPYFFRSGYIYKDLIRKLKNAPLNEKQKQRYFAVKQRYAEYRQQMISECGW